MASTKIQDIYATESVWVGTGKLTVPLSEEQFDNLSRLDLTHCERALALVMMRYRYEVRQRRMPSLRKMAREAGVSYTHARRCVKHLEEMGLQIKRRPGKPLQFFFRGLFQNLRKLVDTGKKLTRDKLVWHEQPKPVPQPEPEPEPLPTAAIVSAPEWATIKEEAMGKVGKGALHWFYDVRGLRDGAIFVVAAPNHVIGRQMANRFNILLDSLIEKYCGWAQGVRYVVKASA